MVIWPYASHETAADFLHPSVSKLHPSWFGLNSRWHHVPESWRFDILAGGCLISSSWDLSGWLFTYNVIRFQGHSFMAKFHNLTAFASVDPGWRRQPVATFAGNHNQWAKCLQNKSVAVRGFLWDISRSMRIGRRYDSQKPTYFSAYTIPMLPVSDPILIIK